MDQLALQALHPGFMRAVQHFGTQADLARALGITPQAVAQFRFSGFSAKSAVKLDRLTGGALPAAEMAAFDEA